MAATQNEHSPPKPKIAKAAQQAKKRQDEIVRTAIAAALIAILKSTPPAR